MGGVAAREGAGFQALAASEAALVTEPCGPASVQNGLEEQDGEAEESGEQ